MTRLRKLLADGLRWLAEVLDPTPEFDLFVPAAGMELEMVDWAKAVAGAPDPYLVREEYFDITEPGEFGGERQDHD